jgi:hypothetical protein
MKLSPLLLAASMLALAIAAPASALSDYGASTALSISVTVDGAKSDAKTHTCQAGRSHVSAGARSTIVGNARKTAVVACEQPPRSEIVTPTLKQAAAAATAVLG